MEKYMELALEKAEEGKTPFGAVIVQNGKVLASAYNTVRQSLDPTAHAEINAIRAACKVVSEYKLKDAVLYTTCEPCPMCATAAAFARIGHIYYGASIPTISHYLPQIHIRAEELLQKADMSMFIEQKEEYKKTCEVLLRQFT